jgi:hypothetical protein
MSRFRPTLLGPSYQFQCEMSSTRTGEKEISWEEEMSSNPHYWDQVTNSGVKCHRH